MLGQPIKQQKSNLVQIHDLGFAPADNYELRFIKTRICRSISIQVQSISYCKGVATFFFDLACELDTGEYQLIIYNITQASEYKKIAVIVYD